MTVIDSEIRSPRALFAQRFGELYAAAGNPTLRRVAAATERRMRGAQSGTPSAQRISDWKAGRNVPARFESLLPVVLTLVEMTEKAQRDLPRTLADPHEWRRLWQESVTWTATAGDDVTCPYPGLRAYRPEEHTLFFGREQATADFAALVRAATGIVVLIGASGAGKSSLLAAGLRPAIDLPAATMTPGATPTTALATALSDDPAVLIVDQFEELFTLCQDEAERSAFLTSLTELTTRETDPPTVVLALRADFYEPCLHYPVLRNSLQHNSYLLGAMSMDEVSRAITGPAAAAGLTLEPGLSELVLAELRGLGEHLDGYDPGTLPLLSHVMAATWQQRDGRKLTVAGYRKVGGVAGSVAETAELAWGELTSAQRSAAQVLLGALVTVGQDTRDTRRTVERAELLRASGDSESATDALEVLAASRLITVDTSSVQLTHEIVLSAWPRLRGWIDADRVGYAVRQRLERDAAEWSAAARDPALLYRGTRLDRAREHVGSAGSNPRIRTFLHASKRAARNSSRRRIVAVVVVFALLATGVIALDRTRLADQRALDRDHAELVAAAQRTRATDPSLSAQFLLAAYRIRPDDATRNLLLNSQDSPLGVAVPAHARGVSTLAFRPADALLVSIDDGGEAAFWDLRDSARPRRLATALGVAIAELAFVPGSTNAITIGRSGTRLWDLARPEYPRLVHTLDAGYAEQIAVDPTGTTIAQIAAATLTLWDIRDRSHPARTATRALPGDRHTVAFVPGTTALAIRTITAYVAAPDTVQTWDATTALPLGQPISVSASDYLQTFTVSPDGTRLATITRRSGGATSTSWSELQIFDITDPSHPRTHGMPTRVDSDGAVSISFHPDGKLLAIGNENNARLWHIADPAQPVQAGPTFSVSPAACPRAWRSLCTGGPRTLLFLPGEPTLIGAGDDGLLRIWTLPPSMLEVLAGTSSSPVFDGTGNRMAVLDRAGELAVWDTTDLHRPTETATIPALPGLTEPALSPDGRTLTAHDEPGRRRVVFDLEDPRHPRMLPSWPLGEGRFSTVVGNRMLVTGRNAIQVWNVTDRTAPTPMGPPITARVGTIAEGSFSSDGKRLEVMLHDNDSSRSESHFYRQLWNLDDPAHPQLVIDTEVDLAESLPPTHFLPDNRTIAVTRGDQFGLWGTGDSDWFTPIVDAVRTEIAPISWISSVGTGLAVSSEKGTTTVWDITDPREPRRRLGPIGPADGRRRTVTMHPGGQQLVFITDDGQLGVWDLDPEAVAAHICASTGMLTEAIWRTHVANGPYRAPCP
ncbi:WD40 repeat domain-containing protein [Nocardia caishijiensis]|uniref:WD40 repeat protein n=1 Tax=Nocardia caishijiensis TaxID=184756 RepID=A0ABQ6YRH8_9NOCA|nr:WD40 repeat domain-containing protein [Nocardia caishijiensis]KAF0848384.1 WD40 repeat protein [Nocardia caishijiensis]